MGASKAAKDGGVTTKDRLIAAASAIMRDEDRINITLQDVAAKSGLNSALVRYHFGNKEGLMFAVLENDITKGLARLQRLLEREDYDPNRQMRIHISAMVEAYARFPYLHRLIQLMTRDATEERVQWIADEVIHKIASGQKQILDRGVAEGLFRKVDPVSFYFTVVGAADSLYSQRFVMKSAFGLDRVDDEMHKTNIAQITEILMRGLLVTTADAPA